MQIKVKEGWIFKTDFNGVKFEIGMRAVNGIEELSFGVGKNRDHSAFMSAVVTSIKPDIELDYGNGNKKIAEPADLPNVPELLDLYFEILAEYGRKTSATEEQVKN